MKELDDLLKESLDPKSADLLVETDTLRKELSDAFASTPGWMVAMGLFDMVLAGGCFIASIVFMFRVDDLRWTVIWAASAVFFGVASGVIKLWFYIRANRNRVLREVKRLELAVSALSARLK